MSVMTRFAFFARFVGAWWVILGVIFKVAAMYHGGGVTIGDWPILILVAIITFFAHQYIKAVHPDSPRKPWEREQRVD